MGVSSGLSSVQIVFVLLPRPSIKAVSGPVLRQLLAREFLIVGTGATTMAGAPRCRYCNKLILLCFLKPFVMVMTPRDSRLQVLQWLR
jgi:hypothetical protein